MSTSESTLVDTSAWYALFARDDAHHEAASAFYREQRGNVTWVTTDVVLAETLGLLTARAGHARVLKFWEHVRHLQISVYPLEAVDLEAAWYIARGWADQDFSFVDCTSFALMERLGITQVFSFDSHFLVYRYGLHRQHAFHRVPS